MPFGIFAAKPPSNIYEKHLPQNLYEYLTELGLLDGVPHKFQIGKHEVEVKVKSEFLHQFSYGTQVEVVMIVLTLPERTMSTSFTEKVWWGTVGVGPEGIIEDGNIKQFPLTGLPEWKCKWDTNDMVKTMEKLLKEITHNNQVKLKPGACYCALL